MDRRPAHRLLLRGRPGKLVVYLQNCGSFVDVLGHIVGVLLLQQRQRFGLPVADGGALVFGEPRPRRNVDTAVHRREDEAECVKADKEGGCTHQNATALSDGWGSTKPDSSFQVGFYRSLLR